MHGYITLPSDDRRVMQVNWVLLASVFRRSLVSWNAPTAMLLMASNYQRTQRSTSADDVTRDCYWDSAATLLLLLQLMRMKMMMIMAVVIMALVSNYAHQWWHHRRRAHAQSTFCRGYEVHLNIILLQTATWSDGSMGVHYIPCRVYFLPHL